MKIVEDNTFDFLVRDHLKKMCEERNLTLSGDSKKDQLMLDTGHDNLLFQGKQGGGSSQSQQH